LGLLELKPGQEIFVKNVVPESLRVGDIRCRLYELLTSTPNEVEWYVSRSSRLISREIIPESLRLGHCVGQKIEPKGKKHSSFKVCDDVALKRVN
jgi:hypothetical protein